MDEGVTAVRLWPQQPGAVRYKDEALGLFNAQMWRPAPTKGTDHARPTTAATRNISSTGSHKRARPQQLLLKERIAL